MMTIFNKDFLKASGLLAAMCVTVLTPGVGQASVADVPAGYDFFQTDSSSYWRLDGSPVSFQGVPIGTCTAGSCGNGSVTPSILAILNGTVVGNTDTIVLRTNDVMTEGGLTGLAIQALQLVNLNYLNSGANLYATLATSQSGLTGGTMNGLAPNTMQIFGITTGIGTFNSYLDFNVSFYMSSLAPASFDFSNPGTSVGTSEVILTAFNVAWSFDSSLIGGSSICPQDFIGCHGVSVVTPILDGNNNSINTYFYPVGFIETVPEPSTLALFGLGLALFGYARRKAVMDTQLSAA